MKRVLAKGTVMDGNAMATTLLNKLRDTISARPKGAPPPKMAILMAGSNQAAESYVRKKVETAERIGIQHALLLFGSNDMGRMLQSMDHLNRDKSYHGYIVQLPLIGNYDQRTVLDRIALEKDVDCLHSQSLKRVELMGEKAEILPCTSQAILSTLDQYGVSVKGKRAVVIGKSLLVGLPIAMLLAARGAQVQSFDREHCENLHEAASQADIIVSAAGERRLIKNASSNALIFDVGYSHCPFTKELLGDIDICRIKSFLLYTPVPGGIGPLTVAMLMKNVVAAWQRQLRL